MTTPHHDPDAEARQHSQQYQDPQYGEQPSAYHQGPPHGEQGYGQQAYAHQAQPSAQQGYGQPAQPYGDQAYGQPQQSGQPAYGQQPAYGTTGEPARQSDARVWTIAGAVSAVVALLFLPIILGPLGAIFGFVGYKRGDRAGLWVGIFGIVATIVGMLIGALVYNQATSG